MGIRKRQFFPLDRRPERAHGKSPLSVLNEGNLAVYRFVIEKSVGIQDPRGQTAGMGAHDGDAVLVETNGDLSALLRRDSCMKDISTGDNRNRDGLKCNLGLFAHLAQEHPCSVQCNGNKPHHDDQANVDEAPLQSKEGGTSQSHAKGDRREPGIR